MIKAFSLLALLVFAVKAPGESCQKVNELTKRDHMNLGVRFENHNPRIVREFKRALNFWSQILDMEWHEDSTDTCSIELIDGTPEMFTNNEAIAGGVRSFGIVAISDRYKLTPLEWYAISVHELGHLFGLHHNASANSVMYYMSVDANQVLDGTDISALSASHRMRISLNYMPPP